VLFRSRLGRWDPIIALGGGIVGDVAGFVAATYRRGVPVIQCPTTLLSMVDASVGGKTGVNLETDGVLRKNMAGSFWQPRAVIADTETLASLEPRVLRAGLGECLKHGLLSGETDPKLYDWTIEHLDEIRALDRATLVELVARNVAHKASVVLADEREESAHGVGRAALNLGHTFAHVIETIPHLSPTNDDADSPLMHGEAVLLGLVASAAVSVSLGKFDAEKAEALRSRIESLGVCTRLRGLPENAELIERMHSDKKVRGNQLRLILPTNRGTAEMISLGASPTSPDPAIANAGWDAVRGD